MGMRLERSKSGELRGHEKWDFYDVMIPIL
jgi:hypothetical protein